MSILGEAFPVDIFLSYRWHDQRKTGESAFIRWVRHIKPILVEELEFEFSCVPSIFWDHDDISRSQNFNSHLEINARSSAIFVPLVSHEYPKSDYCKRELEWWRDEQARRGWAESDRILLINVCAPPSEDPNWKSFKTSLYLQDLLGIDFYKPIPNLRVIRPFGWQDRDQDKIKDPEFQKAMADFIDVLCRSLHTMCAIAEQKQREEKDIYSTKNSNLKIYIYGKDVSVEERKAIAVTLAKAGLDPISGRPVAVAPNLLGRLKEGERIAAEIDQCDGVLLIAPEENANLESEAYYVYGLVNTVLAKSERPNRRIPIVVGDPITDPQQVTTRQGFLSPAMGHVQLDAPKLANLIETYIREQCR
ncbi:toll/interleukin-1 receptor domain-containing protein [Pleomorphomonas sp. PLEO]|uniref:toll/interleukin-1 receptor domain-containing protein n=1 Tax=Pleomorphomonas sp. PLEO TaxID=3239306 RepID=UPI00351DE35F